MEPRTSRGLVATIVAAALAAAGIAAALVVGHGSGHRTVAASSTGATHATTVYLGVTVPRLTGLRLDEAKQVLEARGFDHQVHGGGLLGVLDDGNWVVCRAAPAGGDHAARGARVEVWVQRSC